jgi:hypothetical protein
LLQKEKNSHALKSKHSAAQFFFLSSKSTASLVERKLTHACIDWSKEISVFFIRNFEKKIRLKSYQSIMAILEKEKMENK